MATQLWDEQTTFRWSLEQLASDALDAAGADLDPRAHLIGLPLNDGGAVVVEPARGNFDRDVLATAPALAARRLKRKPIGHDEDPAVAAAQEARAMRRALADRLDEGARTTDRVHHVGLGIVIGDHRIFPVLAVQSETWRDLPRLTDDAPDDFLSAHSFQEAVVTTVLDAAARELDRQQPGDVIRADTSALLRTAADTFVSGIVARTGQELAFGALQAFDAVSAEQYEGRAGQGSILLSAADDAGVQTLIKLGHPVPIARTQGLRKILELSGPDLPLLCDGREVHGVGTIDATGRDHTFLVRVTGKGSWELWDGEVPLLRVDNGVPALPRELLDADEFAVTVDRCFPDVSARNARNLWAIAKACSLQPHGTLLVVHPEAESEANRLLPQGYTITPTRLSDRALTAATGIDGAVLVSPDGRCHAVGVILDGVATGTGDPSRGARYNSAIRYLAGAGRGSMVIIVSEDGRIDVLPKSKRRLRRSTVQRAVDRLVDAAHEADGVESFERADRAVQAIEFYLNQAQCDAVNAAREAVEGRQWGAARVARQFIPVAPDPAMDDSYFIDRSPVT